MTEVVHVKSKCVCIYECLGRMYRWMYVRMHVWILNICLGEGSNVLYACMYVETYVRVCVRMYEWDHVCVYTHVCKREPEFVCAKFVCQKIYVGV